MIRNLSGKNKCFQICIGTLTGFTFYVQIARPVRLGLYRPVSGCTFTLIKSWTPTISNTGVITVRFCSRINLCINLISYLVQYLIIFLNWLGRKRS